jgi:hypothetical protein
MFFVSRAVVAWHMAGAENAARSASFVLPPPLCELLTGPEVRHGVLCPDQGRLIHVTPCCGSRGARG